MPLHAIGAAVLRREDRPERRATVTAVEEGPDGPIFRLAYAEGGEGWWPEEAVEAEPRPA